MDERQVTYANAFRSTMGLLETQIVFGLETPLINDETGVVEEVMVESVVDLRINPVIAKQLAMVLTKQVEDYEKQFGKINLPEEQSTDME